MRAHAVLVASVLLAGACVSEAEGDTLGLASTTTSSPTTTTTTVPSTTTAPTTTVVADADEVLLARLVVAPEHLEGYERDLFDHWIDADHDGCNTRCEVLEAERRPDVGWVSVYDGFVTTDKAQLEIDHVVALAEAWRSGAWAWDDGRREAFANDLDEPDALIAVSASSNQSKADKDTAGWRPPNRGAWCQWARGWAAVKAKWELTVDTAELAALRLVLADC